MWSIKFGLISDIHTDLKSLEKALARLKSDGVDRIVSLGDQIDCLTFERSYIQAKQTLDMLIDNKIDCICGNHEEWIKSIEYGNKKVPQEKRDIKSILNQFPDSIDIEGILFIHCLPEDYHRKKEMMKDHMIIAEGHYHNPSFYSVDRGIKIGLLSFIEKIDPNKRYLLNPGKICQNLPEYRGPATYGILSIKGPDRYYQVKKLE